MAIRRNVVAIVDDDPSVRKAMVNLLSTSGYCTELFASGGAFLDAATTCEATCLVVDIQLGDITGVELGRHLAATGLRFPIIFMTGLDDETIRSQATALGCVAYLRKPFPASLLLEAIIKAVGQMSTVGRQKQARPQPACTSTTRAIAVPGMPKPRLLKFEQ